MLLSVVPLPPMTPDQQAAYDGLDPVQQALCDLLTAALVADVQAERKAPRLTASQPATAGILDTTQPDQPA